MTANTERMGPENGQKKGRRISPSAVQRRAKKGQWVDKREKLRQERSSVRLGNVTDKLLMKMAETIEGERALEAKDLKALSSALKELGEVKERLEEGGGRQGPLMVKLSGELEELSK